MAGEVAHCPADAAVQAEALEEKAEGLLHLLVRVEDERAVFEHVAGGWRVDELALLRLVQNAALQAQAHGVALGVAHGALHAQYQPVVEVVGVVDPIVINDERVGQRAEVQQPVPVGRRARQARDLQRQDGPHLAQTDLGGQPLEALALDGTGTALTQVLIDDLYLGGVPAELLGQLYQGVLALGRLPVLVDLQQGGLADVHQRGPGQMRWTNLGGHRFPRVRWETG